MPRVSFCTPDLNTLAPTAPPAIVAPIRPIAFALSMLSSDVKSTTPCFCKVEPATILVRPAPIALSALISIGSGLNFLIAADIIFAFDIF